MRLEEIYSIPSRALNLLVKLDADDEQQLSAEQQRIKDTHDYHMLDRQARIARARVAAIKQAEREHEQSCCQHLLQMMADSRKKKPLPKKAVSE